MSKIRPLGKRVVVKRREAQATKGGIILPDSAREKPREGDVIAVGPGVTDENGVLQPLTVQVGNGVLFSSYAGTEVKEGGEEYLIMSEEDILGVLCEA